MPECKRQWIALVAECCCLSAGEIPVDVEDRDDGLHQNVLAEDTVFRVSARVVRKPAVMTVKGQGHVLAKIQLASVERCVGAKASALEVVVLRGATLMEVIEGNAIRVLVASSVDIKVVIPNWR